MMYYIIGLNLAMLDRKRVSYPAPNVTSIAIAPVLVREYISSQHILAPFQKKGAILRWNCDFGTQPVAMPSPPLVLVDCVWSSGNVGRPSAALAPRLPV